MKKTNIKKHLILLSCLLWVIPLAGTAQLNSLFKFYQGNKEVNLDKRGYAIITTRDLALKLEKLDDFAQHKANLGYNVHIVTEEDFAGGKGETAAFNIRRWLQTNYEQLDLLYVLLIGNATPNCGEIPMKVVVHNVRTDLGDEFLPTDYYYGDISGNWDLNGNGYVGDAGDFGEGGLDGVWEVLVGRLLYYGENSEWCKSADLDVLLQRFIDYDNEEDIAWRYNFLCYNQYSPEMVGICGKSLEPNGINYIYMAETKLWPGLAKPDYIAGHGADKYNILSENDFGFAKLQSHGLPTATWGLTSAGVAEKLNADRPTAIQFAGCWTGAPDISDNIGGSMLRHYAICTEPNSMGVTSFMGVGEKVGEKPQLNNKIIKLLEGNSIGYAHWENYADIARYSSNTVGHTMLKHNLYGDPSITIFRNGIDVPSSVVVTPVKRTYFIKEQNQDRHVSQVFTVWSNVEGHDYSKVAIDVDWLDYNIIGASSKKEGGTEIEIVTNVNVDNLGLGEHIANIQFEGSNGEITKRTLILNLNIPQQLAYYSFDSEGKTYLNEQLNPVEGYKISPAKGTPSTAINQIVNDSKVTGKFGNALSLDRTITSLGFKCDYLPCNNIGSSTHSFWLKHGATVPNSGKILDIANGVLAFKAVDNKYVVALKERDHRCWEKNTAFEINKTLESSSFMADTWVYISIVVDRAQNKLIFYQDAVEKASIDLLDESVLFADRDVIISSFDGIIDELTCYNYALTTQELKNAKEGLKITPVYPANKSNVLVVNDVNFQWSSLKDVASYNFYLGNSFNDLMQKTQAPNPVNTLNNSYVVPLLEKNTHYFWRVDAIMTDGSIIKGSVNDFTTPQILWSVPELTFAYPEYYEYDVTDNLKYERIKFHTEYTTTYFKSPMHLQLYSVNESGVEEIISSTRYNKGRVDTQFSDEYVIDSKYLGRSLSVRIWVEKNSFTITNAGLFLDYEAPSANKATFVNSVVTLDDIQVGSLSLAYDLSNDVDNIDNVTEFRLEGCPDWMQIQGNILVSFRAPQASDVGDHSCNVILVDKDGNTDSLTLHISVVE